MKESAKNIQKNVERFTGFADIYDSARPSVPEFPAELIRNYIGRELDTVVDLGCGTGLSTLVWKNKCQNVIGIEPSPDMLKIAKGKECDGIEFKQGFGNNTGLSDMSADAVVCSQSFHWMEPKSTLSEINRILKPCGVFAAVDCDWPPVTDWRAEMAFINTYNKIKKLESELSDVNDTFVRYPKSKHIENIKSSGYFRYCREIFFFNREKCTAERLFNLFMSQGSVQTILKLHPGLIEDDIRQYKSEIFNIFGSSEFEIGFSYRMRLGIK